MKNEMTKKQFTIFLKTIDMKKVEFAELYGLKKDSVWHFTRQTRKLAESLAKRKGFNYEQK